MQLRGHIKHGNRTITIIEQGYVGYAQDNGQPVLLPPGIHVWTSESMVHPAGAAQRPHDLARAVHARDRRRGLRRRHAEQRQAARPQGRPHAPAQPQELEGARARARARVREVHHAQDPLGPTRALRAASRHDAPADNMEKIEERWSTRRSTGASSTSRSRRRWRPRRWRSSGRTKDVSADITKLRRDVLKQALASLAAFIGGVNYSESFHMSAAAQNAQAAADGGGDARRRRAAARRRGARGASRDNPLYDIDRARARAARAWLRARTRCTLSLRADVPRARVLARLRARGVTEPPRFCAVRRGICRYGIEVMSINIISAYPCK